MPGANERDDSQERFLERLRARGVGDARYQRIDELGRGGMGVVLRVFDEDLRRHLAMKVIRDREPEHGDSHSLGRFLEEAQVTAQLAHPNIAPVHELGLDRDGRIFFTMRLVQGDTFADVIEWVHHGTEGKEEWTQTRALGVLLDVCDALAFAHSKGVLHRDLKPSNVMVGRFGETCVMDWGLARVLGKRDRHDLRLKPESSEVHTVRTEAETSHDSPVITMDGAIVGTPAYMSPEQASGNVDAMGPHSDVYALGAMLYHLLSGRMPYVAPGDHLSPHMVLAAVRGGPPKPVKSLRPEVSPELLAICDKAMAREPARRYADMGEFAADLRAYLERRVVKAYASGALAQLRKWVERNRPLAAALAALVLLLVGGAGVVAMVQTRARSQLSAKNDELACRLDDLQRLSDLKRLRDLKERAATLWPAWPEHAAAIDRWLADARALLARHEVHRKSQSELVARALSVPAAASAGAVPRFSNDEDAWWHEQLAELTSELDALAAASASTGSLPADVSIPALEKRRAHATWVEQTSLDDHVDAWNEARARIAKSALYGGLELSEQMGLAPLGPDPASGLEEFWHVESGERPRRDATTNRFVVEDATGMVFVLLPGGRTRIGAWQPDEQHRIGSAYVDDWAYPDEAPVNEVQLAPFFIAKHEMTQAQWLRVTGTNPAWFTSTGVGRDYPLTSAVESVNFDESVEVLNRLGMRLPTEAEWEYAARGGTTTPYWFGTDKRELAKAGNVADQATAEFYLGLDVEEWNDGFAAVAPVGRFEPNPFGLHDVCGNVWERCADDYSARAYDQPCRPEDGLRLLVDAPEENQRTYRGGAWSLQGEIARSSLRGRGKTENRDMELGVRAVRSIRR